MAHGLGFLRVCGPSCVVSSSVILGQETPLHPRWLRTYSGRIRGWRSGSPNRSARSARNLAAAATGP
jgi:hypothetical protein